ncbi:MAG: PhnD/SsuA/transferrin family substrate-binding protein, partial [Acidimicrobiia bacterium]|nr:PhnD/SsuA/transferrin family substrate-binding protein [Acidimicrobiia bacterium]
ALAEFQGAVLAFNSEDSQSGYFAIMSHAEREGVTFAERIETGAHRLSATAVAEGNADVAAIDAVSWRLMERYDDVTTDLRVAFWSKPTPGLPYIAAPGVDVVSLRAAIESALQQLTPADRDALGIVGLERISPQLYLDMDDND